MKLNIKIYNLLVNRVPAIQKSYHRIRQQKKGTGGRIYAWTALVCMNLAWLFGKRKFGKDFYCPDDGKKIPSTRSESALSFRETPQELAKRLMDYDVISFDVFDTLVFRPFACPTDLFFVVGEKLRYLDFERIRRDAEGKARRKAHRQTGSYEITLEDIYDVLWEEAGIPKKKGMQAEMDTEIEMCFGNPYMLEVFRYLKDSGKKIICTSDMYLPLDVIQKMVEKCGYCGISAFFISCEEKASKGDGTLYQKVKETFGTEKTYIHVGDHPVSDVEKAEKSGFASAFYQNVNIAGMPYRAEDMSIIAGSLYRGIVNAHIHNGLRVYSREYELGFIYGGLFVVGYCQWIHEYVKTHEIDKVLFLARDGDILNQVYTMLYPEESGEGKTEYVYWSRLAATKMSAKYFKYDYFRRFLFHKVNQDYTMYQIFAGMEIEDMLPKLCEKMQGITEQTKLTDKNVKEVQKYLQANWKEVTAHYTEQLEAGKQYYSEILQGCRRVAAVDIGWAGSGAVALNHIVNDIWKFNCEVIGLLAGTNTVHNAEPNMSEPMLYSGQLASYLFSQEYNRDLWKWHDAAKDHNLFWEILLSSTKLPFRGFWLKDGKTDFNWKKAECGIQVTEAVQQGIRDFAEKWQKMLGNYANRRISGSDSYAVCAVLLNDKNKKYREQMLQKFHQEMGVG